MVKPSTSLALLGLLLCSACESDESELSVTDFTLHECKKAATRGELETGRETADYAGLECVAWRFSDKGSAIDLINRYEGCGWDGHDPAPDETLWTPKLVQTESNSLTYSVSWEFEGASACGECLHDFSIAATAVSLADADLDLKLATRSCSTSDCRWTEESLTIPRTELKEGIRCRYVDWDGSGALRAMVKGKLGGPPDGDACDDGLVAVTFDASISQCLKACSDDSDCPTPLTECQEGACKLADPW